jgi:predicted GNAT family N-acyltransferase
MPERIPAVLLGKLALDRRLHGQRLGGQLLFDAYLRVLTATRTVAARYLVVDAIDDEAVRFYEHYGFIRSPTEPSMRMVRKISDIQADVEIQ